MPALVSELVSAAIDPTVSSAELLRRALVVTRRLGVSELVDWINGELNGYHSGEVPQYRRVKGQLVVENPIHGPIPLFSDPDFVDDLTDFPIRQSLPELIEVSKSTTGIFSHFPTSVEQRLMRMIEESNGVALRPALKFSTVQINGVIEKVRSRVLEWALDLEEKGVLGEGMTFSPEEKQIVQQQHYHFGDVSGSQIQIGTSESSQHQAGGDMTALTALIEHLAGVIRKDAVDVVTRTELEAELATLRAQAASPKPKWPIIRATASSIKSVLENVAGGALASQALPYLAALIR
ncbi:AbiTii domain-containing protein [Pseudomonas nicosulfuronedens]